MDPTQAHWKKNDSESITNNEFLFQYFLNETHVSWDIEFAYLKQYNILHKNLFWNKSWQIE